VPDNVSRAFAPATVSNLTCGFDLLGFAIEKPGDTVGARLTESPGVTIAKITGDGGLLPRDPAKNTAGVAARALLETLGLDREVGVALELQKGLPGASGLGSSAASAVAAIVATAALIEAEATDQDKLRCAIEAERIACGTAHADNVAPSLFGGLVLVRGKGGSRVDRLAVPERLFCAVIRPHVEIRTEAARAVLPENVSRSEAVTQAGNLAALVVGLLRDDLELVASALVDVIAEPRRVDAVPGFDAARRAGLATGALGVGLSGSGPSIFAFTEGRGAAGKTGEAMATAVLDAADVISDVYSSPVGSPGARLVADPVR